MLICNDQCIPGLSVVTPWSLELTAGAVVKRTDTPLPLLSLGSLPLLLLKALLTSTPFSLRPCWIQPPLAQIMHISWSTFSIRVLFLYHQGSSMDKGLRLCWQHMHVPSFCTLPQTCYPSNLHSSSCWALIKGLNNPLFQQLGCNKITSPEQHLASVKREGAGRSCRARGTSALVCPPSKPICLAAVQN